LLLPKEIILKEIVEIRARYQENYPGADIPSITIKAYSLNFKPPDEVERPSLEELSLLDVLRKYSSILNLKEYDVILGCDWLYKHSPFALNLKT